jgi:hypothetical protein
MQDDLIKVYPKGEPLPYCSYSRNLQFPEIAIAILEVMDEDSALSWCAEYLRRGNAVTVAGTLRRNSTAKFQALIRD